MRGPSPGTIRVTIDDAGLHPSVTEAVEACAARRAVDRISVIATGPVWREACDAAASAGLLVSAHLNCSEPPFAGRTGFPGSLPGWIAGAPGLREAVREEWRLQIERILSTGVTLSRLDSHRHLHHLDGLPAIMLDLAREFGIGSVRAAILPDRFCRIQGPALHRLGRRLSAAAAARGIATPSSMLGFSVSGRVSRRYLERFSSRIPPGECELVMHPASGPVWSRTQPAELDLMTSDWFAAWLGR